MNSKARLIGWSLLTLIIYCTLSAVVYFASLLLLQNEQVVKAPWIASAQKKLYRAGMGYTANNWLGQRECITEDPDLVYKPATGECKFDNLEYSTTLNFTSEGRDTGPKPPGTGIAVIGDSHAMGWGVNDHETFSAVLQSLVGRPVYNLGVASYGTAREFIRLEQSGVLDRVDTVIVQYCNNDYSENLMFDATRTGELREQIFGQFDAERRYDIDQVAFVAKGYWLTLKAPFSSLAEKLRRKNFNRHYDPFVGTLRKYEHLLADKRVIVFYSNPFGQKYRNYPKGADAQFPHVHFVDLGLDWTDHYRLDGHLTIDGHAKVARGLAGYLHSF